MYFSQFLDEESKDKVDPEEIFDSNPVIMDSNQTLKANPMTILKTENQNSTVNMNKNNLSMFSELFERLEKSCTYHEISEIASKLSVSPKILLKKGIGSYLFYGPCEFCNENWNDETPNWQPKIKKSPKKSESFSNLTQSRIKMALENKTLDYLTAQKFKYSDMEKICKLIFSKKGLKYMKDNKIFPDDINWYIRPENEGFFNILLRDILAMNGILISKKVDEMIPKNKFPLEDPSEIENQKNLIKSLNSTCGRHEPNQISVLWEIPINELLAIIELENIVFPSKKNEKCGICRIILEQPLFPEDKPFKHLNNALFSIGK